MSAEEARQWAVSTHSRLKAAGFVVSIPFQPLSGFNTQPPEGGWNQLYRRHFVALVSTHSRLKAAGAPCAFWRASSWFQHTAA